MSQELTVQNCVCTLWTGRELHLRNIAMKVGGKYDPTIFPALVSASRFPKATNSVFTSGRIVSTGAKSLEEGLLAVYKFLFYLQQVFGDHLTVFNFTCTNIVCSASLGGRLNLDLFIMDNATKATWQPDNFAGANYRTELPTIVFVMFKTGKIVIAGFKSTQVIKIAQERMKVFDDYIEGREYRQIESDRIHERVVAEEEEDEKKVEKKRRKLDNKAI